MYFIRTVSSVRIIQFSFVVSFRKLGTNVVVEDHVWICKIHQVTGYKITAGSISILNSVSTLSFLCTTCHFIDKYAPDPHTLHSAIYTASMHEVLRIWISKSRRLSPFNNLVPATDTQIISQSDTIPHINLTYHCPRDHHSDSRACKCAEAAKKEKKRV